MTQFDRRKFMLGAGLGLTAATGGLTQVLSTKAFAAETNGYKALICIFLKGGMDHADTVLPYDQTSYDQLEALRPNLMAAYRGGPPETSRNIDNLLELQPDNQADFGTRRFALSPQMPEMRDMFEAGDMAIVGNVGPLIAPTNRESFEARSVALPRRLFSHNDQQSTWMSLNVEGTRVGWGGRFADAIIDADPTTNPLYVAITTGGSDVFLAGEKGRQFAAAIGNFSRDLNITEIGYLLGGDNPRYDDVRTRIRDFYQRSDFGHSSLIKSDFAKISADGVRNVRNFSLAIEGTDFDFPDTLLGGQLKTVAETISAAPTLGVSRQIFYVTLGGFDSHGTQVNGLPPLQRQISEAVAAFRTAMIDTGNWGNVTLFTGSDFGRTTIDNGDGTDHGWGGHHFVMGGSVRGKRIYGDIPPPILSLPQYTATGGRLIPTVAIDQYAATLGSWFGLNEAELNQALPNRNAFETQSLGFL